MPAVTLNIGWIAVLSFAVAFYILYPLVLGIIANRRLKVGWRYFGYGALIFFLFQLITRVPLVAIIGNAIAPQLKASTALLYTWLIMLALTAGLFEEVGRYVGYRWFMRKEEKTWNKAVMYGLGHGGLESMLYVGGQALLSLISVLLTYASLNALPASQRTLAVQQLNSLNGVAAWLPLLGVWERLWTVPIQVALSVVVLQVFRRGNITWLGVAILAHAVVDFVAVIILQLLGSQLNALLLVELVTAIFGATGLWVIWRLRDQPSAPVEVGELRPGIETEQAP